MIRLNEKQITGKVKFIDDYVKSSNAAAGSPMDANANVCTKNIATLAAEINKDVNIQVNRKLICNELEKLYGKEIADEYIRQLETHEIYSHDESALQPYCVAISMYPFLTNGLQSFGGESKAPKHLSSYCGGFINLLFAISAQFAGAVATVEFLMYFDYFARKDYGDNYLEQYENIITQEMQQVVYALNQPAAARGFQSVFWNISIFDKHYYDAMFGNFYFPDGTKTDWESLDKLQRFFMKWFNKERTKAILTFPVVTAAYLNDGETFKDKEFGDFLAQELSEGNSFFNFTSKNAEALSSCCRLRSDVSDQMNDFSYSLGAGGVMTGSINVITLNMNRFIQDTIRRKDMNGNINDHVMEHICDCLSKEIDKLHKYQTAFRALYDSYVNNNMLPVYSANFINIDKQYLTLGINGLVEGAEYLGFEISNNEKYKKFISRILQTFNEANKKAKLNTGYKFNTEFVPAEGLGVKFAMWDKKDNYVVTRNCYNSYLYKVEDDNMSPMDKLILHGKDTSTYLDGGSAVHLNLEDYPTKETLKKLMEVAIKEGCPYFCFNVKITICNGCNHIDKRTLTECPICGSKNVDYATRVIGYLRRVKDFSPARQNEETLRFYHKE